MLTSPVLIVINGVECRCSRGVAKILNIGQKTMLAELRRLRVLNYNNIADTQLVYDGYFKIKRGRFDKLTTYYTQEGIDYVKELCKDLPRKPEPKSKQKLVSCFDLTEFDYINKEEV